MVGDDSKYTLVPLSSEVPRSLVVWSALHCDSGYNSESVCVCVRERERRGWEEGREVWKKARTTEILMI